MISRTYRLVQVEHAMNHVLLQLRQMARAAAGADDELQFLRRVAAAAVPPPRSPKRSR